MDLSYVYVYVPYMHHYSYDIQTLYMIHISWHITYLAYHILYVALIQALETLTRLLAAWLATLLAQERRQP